MGKRAILLIIGLLMLSISCQLTSRPVLEREEKPTDQPTATQLPVEAQAPDTATPILPEDTPTLRPPTKTPAPTLVPTSVPLVLEDEIFEADILETCTTDTPIDDYIDGVFHLSGGQISMINGRIAMWCYGAIHHWLGTIEFEGYTFASDEADPLTFEVVQDLGYRFIGGIGTVTFPDGSQVELYKPTGEVSQAAVPIENEVKCRQDVGQPPNPYQLDSAYIMHTVQINGRMDLEEWSEGPCVDLRMYEGNNANSPNTRAVSWWVQNDAEYIYFLIRVPGEYNPRGVVVDYFWPLYTGTWAHSDGLFVNIEGDTEDLTAWDEANFYEDITMQPAGTLDIEAAVSESDGLYWFEIKRELNSGDVYDWAFEPGQVIGNNPTDSLLFVIISDEIFFLRDIQLGLGE